MFRSTDETFTRPMAAFVDEALRVVQEADLLAPQGGPVAMLQIENEFGNMEHFYPKTGSNYVQWAADYALSKNVSGVPWMMCQQGEGVGSAPPEAVINTCNGYYCDNWIEQHAKDFPGQPHLWTENWPGWYQRWGEAVPHRPAVDVAFAVAQWYAKGGSFMNYYMAFGGTSFARTVGGPMIITSYDYDVQLNEYVLRAEPKYTLTQRLHRALMEAAPVMLAHDSVPDAQQLNPTQDYCEVRNYDQHGELGCVSFFSNYGTGRDGEGEGVCTQELAGGLTVSVPRWSVSIVTDTCSSQPRLVLNTRDSALDVAPNSVAARPLKDCPSCALSGFTVFTEQPPSAPSATSATFDTSPAVSRQLQDQISLTGDSTDYLWISTTVPATALSRSSNSTHSRSSTVSAELRYMSGIGGGPVAYAFVDGVLQAATIDLPTAPAASVPRATSDYVSAAAAAGRAEDRARWSGDTAELTAAVQIGEMGDVGVPVKLELSLPQGGADGQGAVRLDVLTVSMGLKNYGPYLEKIRAGVVSKDLLLDGQPLGPYTQSVGLRGERLGCYAEELTPAVDQLFRPFDPAADSASPLSWYRASFSTPPAVLASRAAAAEKAAAAVPLERELLSLAVDISGSRLQKGALWVNGRMLGRYWARAVDASERCQDCPSDTYVGPYSADQCRSGCGEGEKGIMLSQSLYKLPADVLHAGVDGTGAGRLNSIVFLDELGGWPEGVEIKQVVMEE